MATKAELQTYTIGNLLDSISEDRWAVRDEAARRHDILSAKMARAQKKMDAMKNELRSIADVFRKACD